MLESRERAGRDAVAFTFKLPRGEAVLGLPAGKHVTLIAPVPGGGEVRRKYTPVPRDGVGRVDDELGRMRVVCKLYGGAGKMGAFLSGLRVGDGMDVAAEAEGRLEYLGRDRFRIDGAEVTPAHVGMVAGGSGITPMFQLGAAMLADPGARASVSLLYACSTWDDVLLKDGLERVARATGPGPLCRVQGGRFRRTSARWGACPRTCSGKGSRAPGPDTLLLLCGPPGMVAAVRGMAAAAGFGRVFEF